MSNYTFSQVPKAQIQRSSFDRSHGYKSTFDVDQMIPFLVDEILPGDTFTVRTSGFVRLATPIYPIMDNMYLETTYWFVPNRLVWDNWVKMMGEQDNPGDSIDYIVPQLDIGAVPIGELSLLDYFGLPINKTLHTCSALPIRAYNLIYDEFFRDQNLQQGTKPDTGDGPDPAITATFPFRRGKRHDYFTSALPWPSKDGKEVLLPLGDWAPIKPGIDPDTASGNQKAPRFTVPGGAGGAFYEMRSGQGATVFHGGGYSVDGNFEWDEVRAYTDLQNATAATVNELRQAFQTQKMYEKDARGGTRYTEQIKAHFAVTSPDFRLQRPEYLGGSSTPINISPVQSTSDTTTQAGSDGRPLGGLSAVGTAAFSGHGFTKSFTEHGHIIGIVNVRADLTYQQGVNKMWLRSDRLDYYYPSLAYLGEQAIQNQEIWHSSDKTTDETVWGYQERFAEYRYKPSQITGKFRSDAAQSLDAWHLAEDFDALPPLNASFIVSSTPLDRAIAVTDEPHFIADFWHTMKCARPMPLYGVPGNIDRF